MDKTIFICQRPSFLNGMARTIDLFGSLNTYDTSDNARMADAKALRADWSVVMSDLAASAAQVENSLGKE